MKTAGADRGGCAPIRDGHGEELGDLRGVLEILQQVRDPLGIALVPDAQLRAGGVGGKTEFTQNALRLESPRGFCFFPRTHDDCDTYMQ